MPAKKRKKESTTEKVALPKSLRSQIDKLDGWALDEETMEIHKLFKLPTYINALAFVAKIAVHAEILNHHPRIVLTYNTVEVFCSTHDAGTITKSDIELAKKIQQIKTNC